jgi:fructokinase
MNFNVIGIGEVLWDLLQSGPQMGGAPANFAYHAHALAANSQVVTRIGNDDLGQEIIRRFQAMALPIDTVQVDAVAPTGTAKVSLTGDGLAHFTIQDNVAWDFLAATPEALEAARHADAICFGSLAQRSETSRNTIQQLVAAAPAHALRVFDINFRQHYYSRDLNEHSLHLANVLKLNDDELPTLAEMFNFAGSCGEDTPVRAQDCCAANTRTGVSAPHEQIERLARTFSLQVVALTRGPNGSLLYQQKGGVERWSDCASRPVRVVDTVGTGDSFTAALVLGLLQEMDLDEVNSLANEVACYVCSQAGATPRMPQEFAERLKMPMVRGHQPRPNQQ